MKKILIAVTMILLVTAAFASNEEVNPAVKDAFKTRFPKAVGVEWSTGANYFKASFIHNGTALFAFYNENAQLIGVMRYVSSTQLPVNLQGKLKKYFAHYWITDLFEMSDENGTGYYVTFQDADNKVFLESTNGKDWKLLSINQ